MNISINLVEKRNPDDKRAEKITKIKGISFAVLALTGFLAVLIFALDYRFSASYVRKQQAELLLQLSNHKEKSGQIFIVNSNLTDISKILNERKKYNSVTGQIAAVIPSEVSIDDYQIDETGITLMVSSASLTPMDEFLNALLKLNKDEVVSGVLLKKLAFETDRYVAEVGMQ